MPTPSLKPGGSWQWVFFKIPIRAEKEALIAAGGHINRAIDPAAAVLKVFDAVHGLEKSLSDPRNNLPGYLSVLKRLEEALRFLGDNCGLAIQWLDDILEYLEDNVMADEQHLLNLKKSLKGLRESKSDDERARLDGGCHGVKFSATKFNPMRQSSPN
ncbi:hypothetical protein H0E87_028927 [Populus deltoides]|uniref:Uncharacterized protein n=1 Tax=Populus deltoides TaxID=3696 RepID=A0A8T2WL08_POPDE|nr:hypothetical protein H0E87_028927 [Populus deltoides]